MKHLYAFLLSVLSFASNATTFTLSPINIGNGYVISGTVITDGTVGYLKPTNFSHWNINVIQTTDIVFTEKNTSAANISQVSTDGKKLFVPTTVSTTQPDGSVLTSDGGYLAFLGGAARGNIPSGAVVADFTLNSQNFMPPGGYTGWQTPFALNFAGLNQRDNTNYTAGYAVAGKPNVFSIPRVIVNSTPTLLTIFGTIVTDGTIGALTPVNFKSWKIVGREQAIKNYNETNSQIINATQVFSDNSVLKLGNPGSNLQIGTPMVSPRGPRPEIVTLGDFTDPTYPNGIASFYDGWNGLVGYKSPLTKSQTYVIANKK